MYAQIPALIGQAIQLFQQGHLPQATGLLTQVLGTQPRNFDALHILGVIRAMQGQRAEAIELFRKALAINKNHSFLQFNMAKALSESGQDAEALVHHRRATQLAPDHAEAWLNYGQSLLKLKHHPEAAGAFEKATAVNPQFAAAWSNLGLALNKLGRNAQALESLNHALELQPNLAEAHYNKGCVLDDLRRIEDALASYEAALHLRPDYADALNNKASLLLELNRIEQAMVTYQQAAAANPMHAAAQFSLAVLHLRAGEFSQGWERFEYRWQAKDDAIRQLQTDRPSWKGTRSDLSLLLWGEQGIGDQILYASILPELAEFPQKKYVALDKRLIPLFARSMPAFDFVDLAQVNDALGFAEQLPLGSLPRYFRPSKESFATAHYPFLIADGQRAAELRRKIERLGKLVCGVSWSSTHKSIGPQKSLSLAQLLGPLTSENLHFVDLQYGDTTAERQALQAAQGIAVQHVDEIDNFNDIDGLAALIQACDVVVTTSNSTAHLAGALGKETLLLLPLGRAKLWYWAEFDGRNPWYPSVRSFAQPEPGQWQLPLERLKQHLDQKSWN